MPTEGIPVSLGRGGCQVWYNALSMKIRQIYEIKLKFFIKFYGGNIF